MKWIKIESGIKPPKHPRYDCSLPVLIYGPFDTHYEAYSIAFFYPYSKWENKLYSLEGNGNWYSVKSYDVHHEDMFNPEDFPNYLNKNLVAHINEVDLWMELKIIE